jgi:hypothetical protein
MDVSHGTTQQHVDMHMVEQILGTLFLEDSSKLKVLESQSVLFS